MIVAVCAIIGLVIGLVCWIYEGHYFEDFFYVLALGAVGLILGFVILLCAQPCFFNADFDSDLTETTDLVSLADNYGFEGSAFIFSSCVNSELQYTYLYESERGLTTKTIDADDTYLRYTNDIPIIEEYEERHLNWLINWLFIPGGTYYIIYIPEGSIVTNQYSIDLQ